MLEGAALAIDTLAAPVQRRRFAPGGYSSTTGRYTEGATTDEPIEAVIHPLKPDEVANLPEGLQAAATFGIWTRADLIGPDNGTAARADQVLYRGDWHEVVLVWPRPEGGFTHAVLGDLRDRGRPV